MSCPVKRCHVSTAMDCDAPVAHWEYWHNTVRGWCEEHTPWSGHYEYCSISCPGYKSNDAGTAYKNIDVKASTLPTNTHAPSIAEWSARLLTLQRMYAEVHAAIDRDRIILDEREKLADAHFKKYVADALAEEPDDVNPMHVLGVVEDRTWVVNRGKLLHTLATCWCVVCKQNKMIARPGTKNDQSLYCLNCDKAQGYTLFYQTL